MGIGVSVVITIMLSSIPYYYEQRKRMPQDNSKFIEEAEEAYIVKAIQDNRQSTEVLNVCVITECVRHCLGQLVAAMEIEGHVVLEITPDVIQNIYDAKKVKILELKQEVSRIIRIDNNGN